MPNKEKAGSIVFYHLSNMVCHRPHGDWSWILAQDPLLNKKKTAAISGFDLQNYPVTSKIVILSRDPVYLTNTHFICGSSPLQIQTHVSCTQCTIWDLGKLYRDYYFQCQRVRLHSFIYYISLSFILRTYNLGE
jgi:hypothetical protein